MFWSIRSTCKSTFQNICNVQFMYALHKIWTVQTTDCVSWKLWLCRLPPTHCSHLSWNINISLLIFPNTLNINWNLGFRYRGFRTSLCIYFNVRYQRVWPDSFEWIQPTSIWHYGTVTTHDLGVVGIETTRLMALPFIQLPLTSLLSINLKWQEKGRQRYYTTGYCGQDPVGTGFSQTTISL